MKMTLKKGILAVAAAGSLCAIGITSVFAAGPANGRNYIDLNQDGICDHREDCWQCCDQNQDGLCDHYSTNHHAGQGSRHHGNHH